MFGGKSVGKISLRMGKGEVSVLFLLQVAQPGVPVLYFYCVICTKIFPEHLLHSA